MAGKKFNLGSFDFSNPKNWSAEDTARHNRRNKADVFVSAIQNEFPEEDPEVLQGLWDYVYKTGSTEIPEDYRNSIEPQRGPTLATGTPDMPQMSAITAQQAYDNDETSLIQRIKDFGPSVRAGAREGLAALLESPADLYNASSRLPISGVGAVAKLTGRISMPDVIKEEAKRLRNEAGDIRATETSSGYKLAGDVLDEAEGFTGTLGTLVRNPGVVSDELGKQVGQMLPTMAGGGPTGMIGLGALQAGTMNAQETRERAKAKGMSDEEADRAADTAFLVSAGANAIIPKITPGGSAVEKLLTGQLTREALGSTASVVAKPLIGETVAEGFTEGLEEMGANVAVGDPWSQNVGKAAALGGALGLAMGAGPAAVRAKQNNEGWAQLEGEARSNAISSSLLAQLNANLKPETATETTSSTVLTPEQAFEAREKEQAAKKARDEEAAFATVDAANAKTVREAELRDAASKNPTSSLAEQLAGVGSQVTRKAPVAPAPAPEVQVDPAVEAARTAATKEAEKIVQAEKKAADKKNADALKAVKAEHATARKTELAALAEKSRSITDPTERVTSVADGILAWDKANPVPTAVPEGWTPAKATEAKGKQQRKKPAPVVAPTPTVTPEVEAEVKLTPKESTGPLDDKISSLTKRLGLQMEEQETAAGRKPDRKKYDNSVNNIITELVKKKDSSSASALRLIAQGKLVLVPSPESVNVQASERGAAMYVPEDGKMYLWTDRAKKGDAVGNIVKAVHEATHAGQFNDRQGRSSVMQQIMGKDRATSAENLIRAAAKKGNRLAQKAVAAAEAAEKKSAGHGQLEVLPYFAGEVAKSNGTTLGSLNSIGRDMIAGAKRMLGTVGIDTDVSFNDVYVATKDITSEIASTDLKPSKAEPMEMVYPNTAKGFNQAKEDGRVFVNETGHELFVLSDEDADMKPDGLKLLRELGPGEAYTLADVFDHPTLYEQLPEAKGILIGVVNDKSAWGSYDPSNKMIDLSRNVVDGKASVTPREIILHEAQHWIQDKSGRAKEYFDPRPEARPESERIAIKEFRQADKDIGKLSREVLDKASVIGKLLPTAEEKRSVMKSITNQANPIQYRAQALLEIAATLENLPADIKNLSSEFDESLEHWKTKARAFNEANTAHRKRYINNVTEGEAFFTQAYASAPQSAIPINPEKDLGYKSEKFAKGDLMRQAQQKQAKRGGLEMVDDSDVELTKGEVKYFTSGAATEDFNQWKKDEGYKYWEVPEIGVYEGSLTIHPDTNEDRVKAKEFFKWVSEHETPNRGPLPPRIRNNELFSQKPQRRGFEMEDGVDEEVAAPKKRTAPAWLTGLFRADKGLSKDYNEIIEFAITSPAGQRMQAEALMGRFDKSLREWAKGEGLSVKEANAKVAEALATIDPELDGWDANLEAFDKAVAQFGEAGDALRGLRDLADNLSLLMLEQRAADPKPLTTMEKKVYSKISSNLGKYSHRSYAANSGALGKLYSNALWDDYNKKLEDMHGEHSDVVNNNYDTVFNAIDTIVNDSLMIPDEAGLNAATTERVNSLYRTWGKNGRTEGMTVDEKREELLDIRDKVNGNSNALTEEAENIVQELLNLTENEGPITTYYRGAKQNTGILQKREDIPASIRKLMGEITDPGMKFVTTIAKQAQFLASNKMMLELASTPGRDILPPGSRRPKGWTAVTGEGYGPLEGYLVSPNMLSAIGDVKQQIASFEQLVGMMTRDPKSMGKFVGGKLLDAYGTAASTSKMAQIVFNPANLIFNLGGGAATMLSNGNINPRHLLTAIRDAKDLVAYSMSPTNATEAATELVKYDIVDSAFVGEIKNEQYRALRTLVREMAGRERSPTMQTLANALHATKAGWKETYAMMDVTFKIANFHREVEFYRDFYEKAGVERTDEQIKREAADVVKRTNFTFRRVAPILKALEAGGLTAFGPYMHEVFRTQGANLLQGLSEINRARTISEPEAANAMRMRGVTRLTGQTLMMGLTVGASIALAKATFGDDEEEEKKLRDLLGDRYGDQDFIRVGRDKNGYSVLMAWSRFDPYGPLTDFLRSGVLAVKTGEMPDTEALMKKLLDVYITPRLIPQLFKAGQTIFDDKKQARVPWAQTASSGLKESTGAPDLYSELLDIGERVGIERRTTKALTNVLENLYGPGIMTSWRETNARPMADDTGGAIARAMSYGGFTFQTLDPSKPLMFAAIDYSNALKSGRSKLTEFFTDNPDRSENEIINAILTQRRTEREGYDDAKKVYEGALAAGMTKEEAAATLKAARLTKDAIASIVNGEFESAVVSKKSIDASKKNELATASKSETAEIAEKWDNIWKLLSGADANANEE